MCFNIGKILFTVRYKELIIYLILKLVNARLQTHKRNFKCSPVIHGYNFKVGKGIAKRNANKVILTQYFLLQFVWQSELDGACSIDVKCKNKVKRIHPFKYHLLENHIKYKS